MFLEIKAKKKIRMEAGRALSDVLCVLCKYRVTYDEALTILKLAEDQIPLLATLEPLDRPPEMIIKYESSDSDK